MVALASTAPLKRAPWEWVAVVALCLLGCGEDGDDVEDIPTDEEPASRIAFVSDRDGYRRIYVMRADGKRQRPLTYPEYGEDTHPVWSPDGRTLAFLSTSDGEPDIYLVDDTGANRRQLTNNRRLTEAAVAWSPDGTRLAYAAHGRNGIPRVYTKDADGGPPQDTGITSRIIADDIARLGRSPDGSSFVYQWRKTGEAPVQMGVVLVDVDGEASLDLATDYYAAAAPAWSPDGRDIAMVAWDDGRARLLVTDAAGENAREYEANSGGSSSWPSWSPDGREIAYADANGGHLIIGSFAYPGRSDIWVVDLQDQSHRQLTNTRDYDGMPAWSP